MKQVTVFGGTGYLGRCIVRSLCDAGVRTVRIAVRHPDRAGAIADADTVEVVGADVGDEASVQRAVEGSDGVVNAVSLYVQDKDTSFHDVNVDGARRVAEMANSAGAALVHISGIGSDAGSPQRYIRARGVGETEVRSAHESASIVRSAVMFSRQGGLIAQIINVLSTLPAFPLFGRGDTRLQPVYRGDVARAVTLAVTGKGPPLAELGGPEIKPYRDIVCQIADSAGLRPRLIPVPFPVWHALGIMAERLPGAPLTRDQVALMRMDNIANPELPNLEDMGIQPRPLSSALGAGNGSPGK